MRPRDLFSAGIVAVMCVMVACGGSPTGPPPPPPPPPPANALPSIDGITAQGRRDRQPANFANVGDTLDVSATVRDAETSVDDLVYQWTATAGTFSGSGRTTTWTAPASAATPPGTVTLTLKVIENYGHPGQPRIYSQEVTSTMAVALHDSAKEVGDMAVRFLTEFSKPQTNRDWRDVMRDFNRARCPDPGEYDNERISVEDHIAKFVMHNYQIGAASVRLAFGGRCEENVAGDACAAVPVFWDSTGPNGRGSTRGTDYLAAVYVPADSRWWLCSSRYIADSTFGHRFYSSK